MTISTMIWVVTFRDSPDLPQQELTRYTEEAADRFAKDVIDNGGVAIVTEDVIQVEDDNLFDNPRSTLEW